jgi:hypothetical protein
MTPSGNTRKFAGMKPKTSASEMRTKAAIEIREKQSTDDVFHPFYSLSSFFN